MSEKIWKFFESYGPTLIASALIFVIGILISKLLVKIIAKALKKSRLEVTAHAFIISVIRVMLYIFVSIIALSKLGVPMTSIIAMITAAGLAVSLAIKENLSNVAGGFIIMFTRPFKVGDYIKVGENEGNVSAINIMYTRVETLDTRTVMIPNAIVCNSSIINYTYAPHRRLELHFSVSYKDDFEKARDVIEEVVKNEPRTLDKPDKPLIVIWAHNESSIDIMLRVWINTEDYWPVRFELLRAVKEAFEKNDITIPFNQLDVHFDDHLPELKEKVKMM